MNTNVHHRFDASSFAVVRLEDPHEAAKLKADLVNCYRPVNAQELFALERMALAQLSILRSHRLEAGLFTSAFNDAFDPYEDRPFQPMDPSLVGDGDIEITRVQNRNYALAEGFRHVAKESNALALMMRFKDQAERQYRRALEDFERLKKLRPELPNRPDLTQPDAPAELMTPKEVNPFIRLEDDRPMPGGAGSPDAAAAPPSPRENAAPGGANVSAGPSEPEPATQHADSSPHPAPPPSRGNPVSDSAQHPASRAAQPRPAPRSRRRSRPLRSADNTAANPSAQSGRCPPAVAFSAAAGPC